VGGVCQPGDLLTAGRLGGAVLDDMRDAETDCAGDRRKSVKKVVKPLTQAARLLDQANNAANDRNARKKLSQAQRAARQASQKLGKERGSLSTECVASLEAALSGASGGLSCLP
jgi:hypothetical protein